MLARVEHTKSLSNVVSGYFLKVALPQIYYNIYGNDLLGKLDSLSKRYYYLTDHLGSVRVTVKDTVGVPVDSWSDYYPFGKEARGSNTVNEPREQFTGKERDAETGLDYFGARYYNADIARFTSLDPDRDKYPHWTPYSYAGNMPVRYIDIQGRGPGDAFSLVRRSNVSIDPKITNSPGWTVAGGAARVGTGLVGVSAGVSTIAASGPTPLSFGSAIWATTEIQLGLISMASGFVDVIRGIQGKPPAELMNKVGKEFGLSDTQVDAIELIVSGTQVNGAMDDLLNGNAMQAIDAVLSAVEVSQSAMEVFNDLKKQYEENEKKKQEEERKKKEEDKKKEN